MRYVTAVVVLALAFVPVIASEPGQPFDCDDWILLEPGLTCGAWACNSGVDSPRCFDSVLAAPDNSGRFLAFLQEDTLGDRCGVESTITRTNIVAINYETDQMHRLAYIDDRYFLEPGGTCGSETVRLNGCGDEWPSTQRGCVTFDGSRGVLYTSLHQLLNQASNPQYRPGFRFGGFTPLLGILQSYNVLPSSLGIRVPYMPEGFPAADSFDTYHGDITTLPDWSQAQPLQCDYPARVPAVGDYLTVADTLPDPAPGSGRYYVTAVHHQGETRFGRQFIGGVMSGRNSATLPVCGP